MATTDIDPVVAALVARIRSVPSTGLVYPESPFARDDMRPIMVSKIDGQSTLRAWWVSGPTMAGRRTTQASTGHLERRWTYTIYGCNGITDDTTQQTLRRLALAVTDAIDLDRDLSGTCHRTDPCSWRLLENRSAWAGVATSWVEISKTVTTLSTP
ncbi:hypothetical protein UFOVP314_38 [uncultured Caudovirales phage]|uniref:Uncharacterized protein n=1 Tax=uncultured Caudovirales phage TaxID=2100421 RepID=A0A6J5LQN5_9CAUD|nr:hypothetical protein UFOVP314_38 [uncultured Caudovirales phage]